MKRKAATRTKAKTTASTTIEALHTLHPSGDKSFEELVGQLLSRLSGERIRRCKSGAQGGVDALAEIPFAIEDKRYKGEVPSRDLEGALASSATTYPDLQLWVLVTTSTVSAQTWSSLMQTGARLAVAVLVLDATASQPDLPGVSTLAALAAIDPERTLDVLQDATWRTHRAKKPDLRAVQRELAAIRGLPQFAAWATRMRNELRELPTWQHLVRSQNTLLRSMITEDAANAFGTRYEPAEAVERAAEADLTNWWTESVSAERSDVAVVLGDRYDGKTWLVYRWLSVSLPTFTVPVFFFSSTQVQAAHGDIDTMIFRQSQRALGRFARHTETVLARSKSHRAGGGPWCVVILDGANEYLAAPEALATAILQAVPPSKKPLDHSGDAASESYARRTQSEEDNESRTRALLITCRTRDFDDDSSWLGMRPSRRIQLGPYNEEEFRAALARRGRVPEEFAGLPASALEMIHRPRYMELMLRHQGELASFTAITADVLHYLDASDKVASREALRRDPTAFKAFLAQLARRWKRQARRLTHVDVRSDLQTVTERVDDSLQVLVSEGVLTRELDGSFVPDLERLALGMGLFIREQLLAVADDAELGQALANLLDPHPDDDEKVRWLRAAVTVSVISGDVTGHPQVLQALLGAWLGSRNFSDSDVDDLRMLAPRLLPPVLDLLAAADARSETVFLFAEPIISAGIAADPTLVAPTVHRWCRLVPVGFPRYIGDQEGEDLAVVQDRITEPSLADLSLVLPRNMRGRTVRACQRFALYLAMSHRSLILGPEDLLALLAVRRAVGDFLSEGEQYALRTLLQDADASWFEQEVRSWAPVPTATRTILLRELIVASERNDLREFLTALPQPTYQPWPNYALTRSELATLVPADDDKQTLRLGERARYLASDPTSPVPPRRWRNALRAAALARFEGSTTLNAYNSHSRDDLDLENVEPSLAAWAPEAGARIWRKFVADIPRRMANGEVSWSSAIEGHTALLTRAYHQMLLDVVRETTPRSDQERHALQLAYHCVLAGKPPSERLRLLLEHPFDQEWTKLYEITAAPYEPVLRQRTLDIIRKARDPRRRRRAQILLSHLGAKLAAGDVKRLTTTLASSAGNEERYAADLVLRNTGVDESAPAETFEPLVHVAQSTAEAALQYAAFLDRQRGATLTSVGLARALSAPETARRRGASPDVSDETAVIHGIDRLAEEVRDSLARSLAHPEFGEGEQFPEAIADAISGAAFDEWIELLLALPRPALHAHIGVLMAVVPRALRTGHHSARDLWALVYPFQRTRVSFRTRFTVKGGLDWALRLIHEPDLDDALATSILRDLIADCRSDSELLSIALAARLAAAERLTAIVTDLLASAVPVDRARARFIAGWLPEDAVLRARLAERDPSGWVERIGRQAIHRLDRERWAREWLRRFLAENSRVRRWAAGRLFVECIDAATAFWSGDILYGEPEIPYATRRAEVTLLLWRAKPDDSKLRDTFLGHKVRELADVIPPWRVPTEWEDVKPRED